MRGLVFAGLLVAGQLLDGPLARGAAGQELPGPRELSEWIDRAMEPYSGDAPGGVMAVVRDGEFVVARAYGMANLMHGIPWDTGTVSNIGSVTKQFTAMGMLLLQEDGALSLDDPIRKHIEGIPDFGAPVTIRHLLNHTSGYREIYNLLPMRGFSGEETFARERAIRIVQRQPELQAAPNSEWNYNNTGFILLSLAAEELSGESFSDFMRARVFEPLGMSRTRVKMVQGEVIPGSAQGYLQLSEGVYRETRDLPASAGAGGIYTTIGDLKRWLDNYRTGSLGGPAAIAEMATPAVLENGEESGYGLGLGVGKLGDYAIYAHTGGDVAHRAYLGYAPELDGGVIVMSNNAGFDLGIGSRLMRFAFLGEDLSADEDASQASSEGASMSESRLEAISGDWVIDVAGAMLDLAVRVADGEVRVQATGQPESVAEVTSDSTIAVAQAGAVFSFRFPEEEGEQSISGTLSQGGGSFPMTRAGGEAPGERALLAYAGRYYSPELETFLTVTMEDGALSLRHIEMEPMSLRHRSGNEFSASVIFFSRIVFDQASNGEVAGFWASNGRTKDVWFRKTDR